MTTYYFGDIEFGRFSIEGSKDSSPVAIIHKINKAKDFDNSQEAWDYWTSSGSESYVSLDAVDENNVQTPLNPQTALPQVMGRGMGSNRARLY